MVTATQPMPIARAAVWSGRLLSGLAVLFLLFDKVLGFGKGPVFSQTRWRF